MKLHTSLLAFLAALLPVVSVRADAQKSQNSPAKPLSAAQTTGLNSPIKANDAAQAAATETPSKTEAQGEALENFENSLPPEALSAMKPGNISLRYKKFKVGPKGWPVFVNMSQATASGASQAVYLDIFVASSQQPTASYQLVKSLRYSGEGVPFSIDLEYLKPKLKRGPILALTTYRDSNMGLLIFPDGLRGRMVEQHLDFSFAAPDKSGNITLEQEPYVAHGYSLMQRDWRIRSTWNGTRFVPGPKTFLPAPFLIVAGLFKNRARLENLRSQMQKQGIDLSQCELLPTKEFPLLPAHSYVLIMQRFATKKEAEDRTYFGELSDKFKFRVMRGS